MLVLLRQNLTSLWGFHFVQLRKFLFLRFTPSHDQFLYDCVHLITFVLRCVVFSFFAIQYFLRLAYVSKLMYSFTFTMCIINTSQSVYNIVPGDCSRSLRYSFILKHCILFLTYHKFLLSSQLTQKVYLSLINVQQDQRS